MNFSVLTLPTMRAFGGGRALLSILALIVSQPIHAADRAVIGEWPGANKLAIWSRAVAVSGGFAYVANQSRNDLVDGDRLAGEPNEMAVLDIRDPAHPVRVGGFATGIPPIDIEIAGNRCYLLADTRSTSGEGKLFVLDINAPAAPIELGSHPLRANSLRVLGTTVYLAGGGALEILDLADPAKAVRLGRLRPGSGDVHTLDVTADHAYVLYQSELRIVDISNPAQPALLGKTPTQGRSAVRVAGHLAYAVSDYNGDQNGDLEIFDVSDPWNPALISRAALASFANNLTVAGNMVCVAAARALGFRGVEVFDVSDPVQPVRVGRHGAFAAGAEGQDVQVIGNLVYFAAAEEGLKILDLRWIVPPRLGISRNEGKPVLRLNGLPGGTYLVEAATGLSPLNWQPLSTHTMTTSTLNVTDPGAARFPRRFYRAVSR